MAVGTGMLGLGKRTFKRLGCDRMGERMGRIGQIDTDFLRQRLIFKQKIKKIRFGKLEIF